MNPAVQRDDKRFLELLERWLQGDFTRSDEGELHALLGADDFRREAWEGFTASPAEQHAERLASLRRRLGQRPAARRRLLYRWMSVAAAFVLLLSAVYLLMPPPGSEKLLTQTQHAPPENAAPALSPKGSTEAPPEFSKPAARERRAAPLPRPEASDVAAAEHAVETEILSADDLLSLPETDSAQHAVAFEAAPSRPIVSAPASRPGGSGAIPQTPFPAPKQNVGDEGFANANYNKKEEAAPARPDPFRAYEKDLKQARAAEAKNVETSVPVGGWDEFRRYLRDHARLTDDARNHNVSGNVRLRFSVDPEGRPTAVSVLQSLGYGCDEAAIRLIQNFRWTPGNGEPVVVEISFVR